MSPTDRDIRENCLSEAIRALSHDGLTATDIVEAAARFEDYVRNGKKTDD